MTFHLSWCLKGVLYCLNSPPPRPLGCADVWRADQSSMCSSPTLQEGSNSIPRQQRAGIILSLLHQSPRLRGRSESRESAPGETRRLCKTLSSLHGGLTFICLVFASFKTSNFSLPVDLSFFEFRFPIYASLCVPNIEIYSFILHFIHFFSNFSLSIFFPRHWGYRDNSARCNQKNRENQNSVPKNERHVPETYHGSWLENMLMGELVVFPVYRFTQKAE